MARLRLNIENGLLHMVIMYISERWPSQGLRPVRRFILETIRHYLEHGNGHNSGSAGD